MKVYSVLSLVLFLGGLAGNLSAETTIFSDDFEAGDPTVWSVSSSSSTFTQLESSNTFSHAGSFSAHNSSATRDISEQNFAEQTSGKVIVSWWVYADTPTSFDLAGFFINSSNPTLGFEITGNDLVALAISHEKSDYVPGLATINNGSWNQLSISYDFDTSQAVFSFNGTSVHESTIVIPSISLITFRTDDPKLYIDDVVITHIPTATPTPTPTFFDSEKQCTIHAVKPYMCKAWPYIKTIIKNPENWNAMASACPGIKKDIPYKDLKQIVTLESQKLDNLEKLDK